VSSLIQKLKQEAIARGLTEAPELRDSRQAAALSAAVSSESTKDELLEHVRQQSGVIARLNAQLVHMKETDTRLHADVTRLDRALADAGERVAAMTADAKLAAERHTRQQAKLDVALQARDDARLQLQELRLHVVALEQRLHDALRLLDRAAPTETSDSTSSSSSSSSSVELHAELTRLRDARVAADAARSAAESELATARQQLAHAEHELSVARQAFGSAVSAQAQVAAPTAVAPAEKADVSPPLASAVDSRVAELNAALARMAANDARQIQHLATAEQRAERLQVQVDDLTRRLQAATQARDAAVASLNDVTHECAQLRSAKPPAPAPPSVVFQRDLAAESRVAVLEQELAASLASLGQVQSSLQAARESEAELRAQLPQIAELREQLDDAQTQVLQLRKALDDSEEMVAQRTRALARAKSEMAQLAATSATAPDEHQLRRENESLRFMLLEEEENRAMQVRILKDEIAALSSNSTRRDVDLEVLKNAVLKLFGTPPARQEEFVRVLGGMLCFSPLETRVALDAVRAAAQP
jgi:chromosome segregation ATPase